MAAKKTTTVKKTARKSKPRSFSGLQQAPTILLPKAASFDELFAGVEEIKDLDPRKIQRPTVKIGAGPLQTNGYCSVTVQESGDKFFNPLTIKLTEALAAAIHDSMLYIEYDTIYFEVVVYGDRSSRVYAKYNQIIGSRIIAKLDATATRAFFRKLSKDQGYLALPRAVKAS